MPVVTDIRRDEGVVLTLALDLPLFALGTIAVGAFYLRSQSERDVSVLRSLVHIPFAIAVDIGIALHKARAVCEALLGHKTGFVRTPKTRSSGSRASSAPARTVRVAGCVGSRSSRWPAGSCWGRFERSRGPTRAGSRCPSSSSSSPASRTWAPSRSRTASGRPPASALSWRRRPDRVARQGARWALGRAHLCCERRHGRRGARLRVRGVGARRGAPHRARLALGARAARSRDAPRRARRRHHPARWPSGVLRGCLPLPARREALSGRSHPFAYAPESPKIADILATLPGEVNHPHLPTIYPRGPRRSSGLSGSSGAGHCSGGSSSRRS